MLQWPGFTGKQLEPDVQPGRWRVSFCLQNPIATLDLVLLYFAARKIEGATLPSGGALGFTVLGPDAAHPHFRTSRRMQQCVANIDLARIDGTGNDETNAGQRKTPVNGQAEMAVAFTLCSRARSICQMLAQGCDALVRHR